MTVPAEKAALSRELADFLIELSIALHKHAMYPEGHPSLAPAAAGVARRAEHLFEGRSTLALAVPRQHLGIEGVATDVKNPLLAELAGRLHRHHLGAITFQRGLRVSEVGDVLKKLAIEADRSGEPRGLGPPEQLRAWDHIRLHPVTYERLELLEEDEQAPSSDAKGAKERGLRGSQLWVGLAGASLMAAALAADDGPPPPTEPAVIAKAIDENQHGAAYDQVIVGYLLQIADELKHTGGAEAVALRRRTSKLVGALQPATLRRLIEMGGIARSVRSSRSMRRTDWRSMRSSTSCARWRMHPTGPSPIHWCGCCRNWRNMRSRDPPRSARGRTRHCAIRCAICCTAGRWTIPIPTATGARCRKWPPLRPVRSRATTGNRPPSRCASSRRQLNPERWC